MPNHLSPAARQGSQAAGGADSTGRQQPQDDGQEQGRPSRRPVQAQGFVNHEVKNNQAMAASLAPWKMEILRLFVRHYRPLLTKDPECNPYLFPAAESLGPRPLGNLATSVCRRLYAATGLTLNFHLFRHLMASLAFRHALDRGDITRGAALVEGLLGNRPDSRAINRYRELNTEVAVTYFDDNIRPAEARQARAVKKRGLRT